MKKTFLLFSIMVIIFTGCSHIAIREDIDKSLNKLESHIQEEKWEKVADGVKEVDDFFHFINLDYTKKDREKYDQIVKNLDMEVANFNKQKSMEQFKMLKKHWRKMNNK